MANHRALRRPSSSAALEPLKASPAWLALLLGVILVVVMGIMATPSSHAAPAGSAADSDGPADDLSPLDDGGVAASGESWIVRFKNGAQRSAEVSNARAQGMAVRRELSHVFSGMVVSGTAAQAERIARRGSVASVEKNMPMALFTDQTNPPWGLDRIDQRALPLDALYRYDQTGSNVRAYVIDTGINTSHTQFSGRILPGAGIGGFVEDCQGHGTHVSGTIAGTTYGVAKQVRIVPLRVLECSGTGSAETWLLAMEWILDNHPAGTPAVINMSVGTIGGPSDAVDAAVATMTSQGFTVVAAAGNAASNACQTSPARASSAITVANSTSADAEAPSSNYGSCVDIYAPGTNITSAYIGSSNAEATMTGTSMAAPHVAGAAALILATNPTMRPADVANRLISNSTKGAITNPFGGTPNRLLFIPTQACGFKDVTTATSFVNEICWLSASGISTGYPDGTFRPADAVRRDAMAAFMYRLAGKPAWTPPARSPFTDLTPSSNFYKEVTWLASSGITAGYPDGTFRPAATVNRNAMAAFMYRLVGKPAWTPPSTSPFVDVTPSSNFYKEITWLADKRISTGNPDGTFRPSDAVKRDAMAAFMYRLDRAYDVMP